MLNEVWRLRQALELNDFSLATKHKRIQIPGRTFPCLRICLNEDGGISSIQDIRDDEWPTWTVMEGKQNSFPVVRIQEPLFKVERGHDLWSKLGYDNDGERRNSPSVQNRIDILKDVLISVESPMLSKKTLALLYRLRDLKAKELADCEKSGGPELKAVTLLADRFIKAAKDPNILLKSIAKQAVLRLQQGRLNSIDAVEQLMIGKGPPDENGKRAAFAIQLAFDINEEDCSLHLYSQNVLNNLLCVLPQDPFWDNSFSSQKQTEHIGIDALTGEITKLEKKTFPQVDFPVFSTSRQGKSFGRKRFPIASMFSEARCNRRYGMMDARVFPLAQARAIHLKEALEEITIDSRWGQTWLHVASGRFDTQNGRKIEKLDLLIVYVEEKPMLDVKTARLFGQSQSVTEAKFEVDAAVICDAFRGIIREKPQSKLNLFLIREVSKGQAQVILSESFAIKKILKAVEQWQRAVHDNLPLVEIFLPAENRKGQAYSVIECAGPLVPYPDQVVRLLSNQWVRDGSSPIGANGKTLKAKQEVVGPGLGEVLALMLRIEGKWEPAARKMLNLLLQRVTPLLIGVFGAKHAYGPRQAQGLHEPFFDYPRESRKVALQAIAVLGILLDALESRKEEYMKDAPYQIGQVLALADTLHKDYCIVVRKGQLPNSLIGTSLMRRALDSPAGALADLSERMLEYVRWAKVAQIAPDWSQDDQRTIAVNEARKKLRQYQSLAESLAACDLPAECDDLMKAQLLLGFLASPPSDEQNE